MQDWRHPFDAIDPQLMKRNFVPDDVLESRTNARSMRGHNWFGVGE